MNAKMAYCAEDGDGHVVKRTPVDLRKKRVEENN